MRTSGWADAAPDLARLDREVVILRSRSLGAIRSPVIGKQIDELLHDRRRSLGDMIDQSC